MPQLSIIILTYNSKNYIKNLLDSLFEKFIEELEKGLYEIVLVDNFSTDTTVQEIKANNKFSKIKFFESGRNLGYANGINLAVEKADGEICVFLNPDSEYISGDFSKIISEFKSDGNLAIAGMSIVGADGKSERNAGNFYNAFTFLLFTLGLEEISRLRFSPDKKMKVDYVSGGFMAVRKNIFEKLHGFDGDFFMYVEDMDLCYRAKKLGFSTHFLPYAKIQHKGQGSSSREFAIVSIYKGLALFYKKHRSFVEELYVRNLLSLKAALIIFVSALMGKKELYTTYKKALESIS